MEGRNEDKMNGILEGVKVLDFGQAIAAPVAACLLGYLGADVIKVEPLEGDVTRLTPTGDDSTTYLGANINKRSLAINLKDPLGKEIVLNLAKEADVIVHNFRLGVMQKLGLDYGVISKINPKVIYCSIYMYGDTGPMVHMRGGDPWAQAMTGVVASVGSPEGPPQMTGHVFIDMGTSIIAAFGIVGSLFQRERTGIGQELTTNLLNVGTFMQYYAVLDYLIDGTLRKKSGRGYKGFFPYGAYPAKDGDVVTIFGQDDDEWAIICSLLGIEHLLANPDYDTHDKRVDRKFELYPILDEAFRKRTCQEWEQLFRERKLRCERCLDYAEFVAHPQFQANDMITEVDHPQYGRLKMLNSPLKFKGGFPAQLRHSPVIGEHSREILARLGFSEEQIETMRNEGVIAIATPEMLRPKPRRPVRLGHIERKLGPSAKSKKGIQS
jgi:crotonobetainyl-CoA:carnitine CoA-transferase CaiB-like acyl-CoA transferase